MIDCKELKIPDVKLIRPQVYADERGYFVESFNQKHFAEAINEDITFVQDNHSKSTKGVLRGLHMQKVPHAQGKLVRVIEGEVYDVAVDMRKNSPFYGQWVAEILSDKNFNQLWIPEGFAHGFLVLSESATFLYKTTNYYHRDSEITIQYNDPDININWPMQNQAFVISEKDQQGLRFAEY